MKAHKRNTKGYIIKIKKQLKIIYKVSNQHLLNFKII